MDSKPFEPAQYRADIDGIPATPCNTKQQPIFHLTRFELNSISIQFDSNSIRGGVLIEIKPDDSEPCRRRAIANTSGSIATTCGLRGTVDGSS
jgi:hypothetical protein